MPVTSPLCLDEYFHYTYHVHVLYIQSFAVGYLDSLSFSSCIISSISVNSVFSKTSSIQRVIHGKFVMFCQTLLSWWRPLPSLELPFHLPRYCFHYPQNQFLTGSGLGCLKSAKYVKHSLQSYVRAKFPFSMYSIVLEA